MGKWRIGQGSFLKGHRDSLSEALPTDEAVV
jgi:hypothetical protein